MAQIQEDIYVIKLSKLVKNTDGEVTPLVDSEFTSNLETILQEMVENNIIVEIEQA